MTGPTLDVERTPVARFTRTPAGWRIRVWGSDEDLSGRKIVATRKNGPCAVRLGQLVAPDEGHGAYYTFSQKGES